MTSRERFETWFADHVVGAEVTFPDFEDGEYVESDIYDSKLYLMLQAMWMGWQEAETASEQKFTELTVQLANAESKCRELAAENAGLNKFIKSDCWIWDDKSEEYFDAADCMPETPATDAYLAEVCNEAGASAVELFAKTLGSPYSFRDEKCYEDGFTRAIEVVRDTHAPRFAAQLRKGVQS